LSAAQQDLSRISVGQPLDTFDFSPYLQLPLSELRRLIGLEAPLIMAWHQIEKQRYPESLASQRLLDD
jgi:hypothetical protein